MEFQLATVNKATYVLTKDKRPKVIGVTERRHSRWEAYLYDTPATLETTLATIHPRTALSHTFRDRATAIFAIKNQHDNKEPTK
jgi:hypothetical protein